MTTTKDRLLRLVAGDWKLFGGLSRDAGRDLPDDLVSIARFLLSRRGEASGTLLAQRLLDRFDGAQAPAQLAFFTELSRSFGADPNKISAAMARYASNADSQAEQGLHRAAEPRRQELIRRLNYSKGGTFRLIKMRESLQGFLADHPELAPVDQDFAHLFASWFNPGFLEVRPISWSTSASVLEKLIRYEAVHAIAGWDDLRSRLDPPDRRCFAFFHPRLPDEPLIFVEVALSNGVPSSIQALLDDHRVETPLEDATTAVFYSISNTQRGLGGVPFGSFLLKHVIEQLRRELLDLSTYVTLSPVPGFARWLKQARASTQLDFLSDAQRQALAILDAAGWHGKAERVELVRDVLLDCATFYLLLARNPGNRPVDPVARFHLRNGAELYRLHFLADVSEKGLRQSFGIMVNYRYQPDEIERNHEAFVERHEVVASRAVKGRLTKAMKSKNPDTATHASG